jgi:hypothetical protein
MRQAYARVGLLLEQQASALAYKDVVSILALVIGCGVPLAFLVRRPPSGTTEAPPRH